eukprot:749432-Prymnesium_polylepis.1
MSKLQPADLRGLTLSCLQPPSAVPRPSNAVNLGEKATARFAAECVSLLAPLAAVRAIALAGSLTLQKVGGGPKPLEIASHRGQTAS